MIDLGYARNGKSNNERPGTNALKDLTPILLSEMN
jgi:hypothetical protein